MDEQFLFVYGTLRRDKEGAAHDVLARYADLVDSAVFQGRLYRVDYYPGVVPSNYPNDLVRGEVYCLHEPARILSQLDEYEECGAGFPEPPEYVRRLEKVRLSDGSLIDAWLYIYNRPTDNLELIESGDFLQLGALGAK